MNATSIIDPLSVLNYGVKVASIGMLKIKPTSSDFGNLYAVITGISQEAREVTDPAEYERLYTQATAQGCPFTVALYFADPAKLIYL